MVKVIKYATFYQCTRLKIVNLGDGIEEMERRHFANAHRLNASLSPAVSKKFIRRHSVVAQV